MENIRMSMAEVEGLKKIAPLLVNSYEDGAGFVITDLEKVTFKVTSSGFDVPDTEVGTPNKAGGIADVILKARAEKIMNIDRSVYGVRLKVLAGPIWDGDSIIGAWIIALPRLHMVVKAFDTIAPLIVDMFPEGATLYISDKEKLLKKQPSAKFDVTDINVGDRVKEGGAVHEVIQTGKPVVKDVPPSVYGVPVQLSCHPLKDEDTGQLVGCFGMALPRAMTLELKEMAQNLSQGLEQIAAAMEEMAASTSEVAEHQSGLNQEIQAISQLSEQINEILNFIRQIADETKMLGLNAAIEAARAGDAGRGFGVVAEEIRSLSDKSKETVVQIRELVTRIQSSIGDTVRRSDATLKVTEQQAAATQEINASIEEITSLSEQLRSIAASM